MPSQCKKESGCSVRSLETEGSAQKSTQASALVMQRCSARLRASHTPMSAGEQPAALQCKSVRGWDSSRLQARDTSRGASHNSPRCNAQASAARTHFLGRLSRREQPASLQCKEERRGVVKGADHAHSFPRTDKRQRACNAVSQRAVTRQSCSKTRGRAA